MSKVTQLVRDRSKNQTQVFIPNVHPRPATALLQYPSAKYSQSTSICIYINRLKQEWITTYLTSYKNSYGRLQKKYLEEPACFTDGRMKTNY